MRKFKKQLFLTIEQSGRVFHQHLTSRGSFTIGKHPKNDITLYGEHFPKKHVLFSGKNSHFQLKLKNYMKGEVVARESRLTFNDMIVHNLLAMKGDSFFYPLTQDKAGFIVIGDAKISFQFIDKFAKDRTAAPIQQFSGYSWWLATFKDLGRDLAFKAILIAVITFHVFLLNYMRKLPIDPAPKSIMNSVPERFAKFIVSKSAPKIATRKTRAVSGETEESSEEDAERNPSEKESREARPESQGVLGLLTGTGSANKSSSLADFLLDKGLVKELDEIMSSSELQLGKGSNEGGLDLDELIAKSELSSGIDDILEGADQVESVDLGEKGQIQIEKVSRMTGTQEALGQRSEESVREVMLSYTGRLTYIYNKYLKREPTLQGKLVVEVVIAAAGNVQSAKAITSTTDNPEFDKEVLNFIRRWKYDPIDSGTVTVSYPLFFNKVR